MLWMLALGVLAVLVVFYVVGRQAIRKDREEESARSIEQARMEGALKPRSSGSTSGAAGPPGGASDAREVVFFANAFHGHFTNGGFDTLIGAMDARELSLDAMCAALEAVGAQPIAPLSRQAKAEYERYHHETDASDAPIGSEEHQQRVKAYLERMRALEAEVDRLGLDVGALSLEYARRNDVEPS